MKILLKKIRTLLIAPIALSVPFANLQAAPQYVITDLGALGGTYSNGVAINGLGQIAGFSHLSGNSVLHPFLWQSSTGQQDLLTLGGTHAMASGINISGQIVGNSQNLDDVATRGFVWNVGAMTELSKLGGSASRANAINDNGVMTGAASLAGNNAEHGVVWANSLVASPVDLGTLGGANSQGNDINIDGRVVGYAENPSRVTHATLWVPPYTAQAQDLGTLGGTYSEAYAVNTAGQVTGISTTNGDTVFRGFIWRPGQAMADIGVLTATSTHTAGYDINTNGDIVGYSTTAGGAAKRAIVRKNGTALADLNGLILPNIGWILSEARGINDSGQIVGIGTLTKVDTANNLNRVEQHAFLLTPDKEKPVITCPSNVTTTGTQPASIGQATATDNLDPAPVITNNRPTTFPNGDTNVVWTAADANGNTVSCTQLVRIGTDTTPPVVSFTTVPAAPAASGWFTTAPNLTWSVTDAESAIASRAGCTNATAIGSTGAAGQTFFCAATSAGGTSPTVSTTLKVDTLAPTLANVPAAFTVAATSPAGAVVSYVLPIASDLNSGVAPAGVSCLPASGSALALGATTVSCTVNDVAGNSSTASFVVTVADQTPPVLSGVSNITRIATGSIGAVVTYALPTAADAISGVNAAGVNCSPASGTTFALGSTTVSCSAIDNAGNAGTASFQVNVITADTTPPVFTNVPGSFTSAATNAAGAVVSYTLPTATDSGSGISPAGVSCSPASGATFALGATTVNCSVSDVVGNSATASFLVTVADQTAPVFSSCPATVALTQGQSLPVLSATDNVTATPTVTRTPSGTLAAGTTAVTWAATDQAGLSANCVQQVTVTTTVTETISVGAQCKVRSGTSGEWQVQGTSSVIANNSIQLYSTTSVPADLTTNRIGGALAVSTNGNWSYQNKNGPACRSPISLRSSATGTTRTNITVSQR